MHKKTVMTNRWVSAFLVVVMIGSFLAPPALAVYNSVASVDGKEYACGLYEHVHGEGCYEFGEPGFHCRDDFEERGLYFYDDEHDVKHQAVIHEAHDGTFCYDADGNLTCYLDELAPHAHDASCYAYIGPGAPGDSEDSDGSEEFDEQDYPEFPEDPDGQGFDMDSEVLPLADVDFSDGNWQLTCDNPDTTGWPEHYHDGTCTYQDRVLACGSYEHLHDETCVAASEPEPDFGISDGQIDGFVAAVNQVIQDIDFGTYANDREGFDAACANIEAMRLSFAGSELTEEQSVRVDDAIAALNEAKMRYFDAASRPAVSIDGLVVLIDRLVLSVRSGQYDSDSAGFDMACAEIDEVIGSLSGANLESEYLFESKLSEYAAIKSEYAAIASSEQVLAAYLDAVGRLFDDIEAGAYDDDMDGLADAFADIEILYARASGLYLTDGQRGRLDSMAARFDELRDMMSGSMLALEGVTFVPCVYNHVVAAAGSETFRFRLAQAVASDGVVMPDAMMASANGTGEASFDAIKFVKAGTYSFNISVEPGFGSYRYDERTWRLSVTVVEGNGVLSVGDVQYALVGGDAVSPDYAEFINVGLVSSTWSTGASSLAQRART